jgi:hypothetical protein
VRNEASFRRTRGRDDPSFHCFILPALQFSAGGPGAIVQNEPNLEGAAGAGRLPCKTKPIRRGRPAMGAGRQVCPAGVARPKYAKRSQFGPDGQERARPVGVERAKQSQFLGSGTEGKCCEAKELWSICHSRGPGETKPIHPNRRGGPRDARPAACPLGPTGQLCKTNPIRGRAGWDGAAGTWDTGTIVRNEPNLEDEMCKTNSIWPGRGEAAPPGGRIVQNEPNFGDMIYRSRSDDLPLCDRSGRLSREGKGYAGPHKTHVRKELI